VHGSAGWPPLRTPRGLVEEYRLLAFPDNVGAGKRLFTEDARQRRVHRARVASGCTDPDGSRG